MGGDTTDTFLGSGKYRGGGALEAADGPAEATRAGECCKQVCTTEGRGDDRQYKIFGIHHHKDTMIETELQGPTILRTVHFTSATITLNCGHKLRTT